MNNEEKHCFSKIILPLLVAAAVSAPQYILPAIIQTSVDYAEVPVVVGQNSQILKPALGVNHPSAFGTLDSLDLQLVRQQKVLAPLRTESNVIPQVTVQYPTRVNVQTFPVDVPIPAPYPQPVSVVVPAFIPI